MQLVWVKEPSSAIALPGELSRVTVPLEKVDWDQHAVLVLDLGEQRSGGHGITVSEVRVAGEQVLVTATVKRPAPGQFVLQAFTHPYAVCLVPRTELQPGTITVTVQDLTGTVLAQQVVEP